MVDPKKWEPKGWKPKKGRAPIFAIDVHPSPEGFLTGGWPPAPTQIYEIQTRVRYHEDQNYWEGHIVGTVKKGGQTAVLVQLDQPTHFMEGPEGIVPEAIRPEWIQPEVEAMGYGIAQAFQDQGVALPAGYWSIDDRMYILENTIPLESIADFCATYHPDDRLCWLQAATLGVVPILMVEAGLFEVLE